MNLRPLRPPGKPEQNGKHHTRWSYQKHSQDFIGWVNKLGIERTRIGRFFHFLDTKFFIRRIALLFLFCLSVAFFISWDVDVAYFGYRVGDLATSDIKSPMTFEVIDFEQTNRRRMEAEEAIPPVYDYDMNLYDQMASQVRVAFGKMRGFLKQGKTETLDRRSEFEGELNGHHIPQESFKWLLKQGFRMSVENSVVQVLQGLGERKITEDLTALKQTGHDRIIGNLLEPGELGGSSAIPIRALISINEVKNHLEEFVCQGLFEKPSDCGPLTEFVRSLIVANLTPNKQETEIRKERARDSVSTIVVQVKKGDLIVRKSAPLQKIQIAMLEELRRLQTSSRQDLVSLITAIFLVMILLCYWAYLGRFVNKIIVSSKDVIAMGFILYLILGITKFIIYLANTALLESFPNVPSTFYAYLVPASAGAMMVGLLIPSGEVVWLFSMFLAVSMGLLFDRSFTFMIITFTSSVVAARGVFGCKKRQDLYLAGLRTGIVNAGLIFCASLINSPNSDRLVYHLGWNTPAGFISGIMASFMAMTLIPLWESIFVYTTDVKLLELSNLNHPLLRDLTVKAPGTYHHSLVVGSMCEAAAEAIEANSLLAKVCAYYHDIGKTNYANYFIENQRPGENKHDHISPGMSKTILVAHVKDGVEMALKYKMGRPIIDVIEQHHGTTLISFFYHKAKESEDTEMHEVAENEYRYPGPKPQFREAALCMLADSIEAAARTLDEPTPARLQNIVKNIVQKKFLDGQLDECNLTLRDLTDIEEAFSRVLLGIYHQRIDYPTSSGKKSDSRKPQQTVS